MKSALIFGIAGTFVAILILATYLIATDRDPTLLIGVLIPTTSAIAILFQLNTVQKQTNGTLSAMREESAVKDAEIKTLLSALTPEQIASLPQPVQIHADDTP